MEKEIKKNSIHLIESSLPGISSLDNITPKKIKNNRELPLFLVPLAVAFTAIVAITIPAALGFVKQNNQHSYNFNFDEYRPTAFKSFGEVAYYSYLAYSKGAMPKKKDSNIFIPRNNLMKLNEKVEDSEETENETEVVNQKREAFDDNYGRRHYPVDYNATFTFSNFLYFEFDSVDNVFLDEKIGNGHIYGLAVKTSIFDENMLILRNGEYFYSCFGIEYRTSSRSEVAQVEFSACKTVEGFDFIKDLTNMRSIDLLVYKHIGPEIDYSDPFAIQIENDTFDIDFQSIYYDEVSIECTVENIKECLNITADIQIVDNYGGTDALVYDTDQAETASFTFDEIDGELKVTNDGTLTLNDTEVISVGDASKIYISEINKDSCRDIVFECGESSEHRIVAYDLKHNRYLFNKTEAELGDLYSHHLGMINNHLSVKLLEKGANDDKFMVDYGRFGYRGNDGVGFSWKNYYGIIRLELVNFYEADGITPVGFQEPNDRMYFKANSNTPYIIEMKFDKGQLTDDGIYPDLEHAIVYEKYKDPYNHPMPDTIDTWNYISHTQGIYRYQVTFKGSGYSHYNVLFNEESFEFKVAVDVPYGM